MPRQVGELAVPVKPVAASTPLAEVQAMLRGNPLLPGAVVRAADGQLRLLSRAHVEQAAVPGLDRVPTMGDLPAAETLKLRASTAVDVAAEAALARPPATRDDAILVTWPHGRYGIAPMLDLIAAMARRYVRLTRTDALTGLANRHALTTRGEEWLREHSSGALLVIDLDRFAEINDALGYRGADQILRQVATALDQATRPDDVVARLDGDQFAVLLAGRPDGDAEPGAAPGPGGWAERLAHQLTQRARGPFTVSGIPVSVEMSIGVAHAADPGDDVDTLLRRATVAMQAAKRSRTGTETWDPHTAAARGTDLRLMAELRTATQRGQLRLHYQPLVDAASGRPHGVEALVRWEHPDHGILPPGAFLPDAERSDIILDITDWVLAEAIGQAAIWRAAGTPVPVSVNISAAYLAQDRAVATVAALLAVQRVPADLLTVEITESTMMTRPEQVATRLTALRDLGARVSVDDFGTGYTSLALLPELPIDELKIDRSFVSRMVGSAPHAAIVRTVTDLAKSLGVTVVAEGIEDEPTAAALRALGVDLLQGYHFARPQSPELVRFDPPLPAAASR
ncbi:putative bifunctional diguanylate cyclase/phosphodiesterase [Couchioplanes azureus]|uniref:putative bifunctional diguanylate cyclase/phosphodiesterase n=1 Tax=Couchioplanes caeruleus TaxID=56438 RepID=UPI0016705219|nr:bifunctional diguanylate cyclase/phosphodiesterase [Couchioplanes caeruleus]